MADVFDRATRSRVMRAIKSRDTKPELALWHELRRQQPTGIGPAGIELQRGDRKFRLPGTPDFLVSVPARNIFLAVFAHGCYWHLCARHYKAPAGAAWRRKMDANRRRDVRVRRQLRRLGWTTMVVWEHEEAARGARRVWRRIERMRRDGWEA